MMASQGPRPRSARASAECLYAVAQAAPAPVSAPPAIFRPETAAQIAAGLSFPQPGWGRRPPQPGQAAASVTPIARRQAVARHPRHRPRSVSCRVCGAYSSHCRQAVISASSASVSAGGMVMLSAQRCISAAHSCRVSLVICS